MPSITKNILVAVLVLGGIEGFAYWWMHPAPAGLGQPVLVYRPEVKAETLNGEERHRQDRTGPARRGSPEGEIKKETAAETSSADSHQKSEINCLQSSISPSSIQSSKFKIQNSTPSNVTLLPDVVARSIPSLHCTTGTAARIDRDDGVTIFLAFFEWNLADSTNVLEAYKHLPEECMGSIGMKLISKEKPILYRVRSQESVVRRQEQEVGSRNSKVRSQEEPLTAASSIQKSSILNHQSSLDSSFPDHTLSFDHTVFRDQAGVVVHAFKGTWVSGANTLLGDGLRGGGEQARQIRWKSALKRFHPAYARVAQGAVRGIPNPDLAWEAFESAMLVDLKMEKR